MPYKNLEQILALSKTGTRDSGVEIPPFPKLNGKLAAIDPQGVEKYNAAVAEWVQKLAVKARQQEFEQNLTGPASSSVTSEDEGTPDAAPTIIQGRPGAPGSPGSPGATGGTGATGPPGPAGANGVANVTIGGFLDPNGSVVGNVKDLYFSSPALGGDGTMKVKTSGTGTNTGWE